MKCFSISVIAATVIFAACNESDKSSSSQAPDTAAVKAESKPQVNNQQIAKSLFIDVHVVAPGKVKFADVMAAHQKDLATEGKYDVNILKFWLDEKKGKIYCLSSAKDSESIVHNHAEAHGLLPSSVFKVTEGQPVQPVGGKQLFLDVHQLGAGNVTAAAVADAHSKDLAAEKKYGVNILNYWLDEKNGTIVCLSEAPDSNAIIHTHKDAHGLLPAYVLKVKQGE
jgi:Nickel responsive protein SCO4226-like